MNKKELDQKQFEVFFSGKIIVEAEDSNEATDIVYEELRNIAIQGGMYQISEVEEL